MEEDFSLTCKDCGKEETKLPKYNHCSECWMKKSKKEKDSIILQNRQ